MIVLSSGNAIERCCFTKLNTNSSTKSSTPLIVPTVAAKSRRFNSISYLQPFMPYDCGICTYYGYHDPTTNYLVRTAGGSIVNTNCRYYKINNSEYYISCVDDGTQKLKGYMYSSYWDDKISRTNVIFNNTTISGLKFDKITMGTGVDYIYISNMAIIRTKNMIPSAICIPVMSNANAVFELSNNPPTKPYSVIGTSDGYTYYCVGDSYRENPTPIVLQNENGYVGRNLIRLKIQDTSKEASVQFCYTETALIMGEQPLNAY